MKAFLKKYRLCVLFCVVALCQFSTQANAQDVAVKTNLLYDATATINAGVEFGLSPKWTLDLSGNYNAWPINDRKWKHWLVQPEARYWFCDRFQGHFLGVHLHALGYNVGYIDFIKALENRRYQGYAYGGGIGYGYAWAISRALNLEFEIGVGYAYTEYDKYECDGCGQKLEEDVPKHYVGPTKAAINLVYVF